MKTTEKASFKVILCLACAAGVVWLNYTIVRAIADEITATRSSLAQHEARLSILEGVKRGR